MKTAISAILLAIIGAYAAHGQINRQIELTDRLYDWPSGGGKATRSMIGTLSFQSMPAALETTTVDFNVTLVDSIRFLKDENWVLKLAYRNDAVAIVSDSIIPWNAPHNINDQLTGQFRFIPLRSGTYTITLYLDFTPRIYIGNCVRAGLSFAWCIDANKQLTYLGKLNDQTPICDKISTYFFGADSVIITPPSECYADSIEYKVIIKPVPKIGEACTFYYYFKALRSFPEGCVIDISSTGMKLLNAPNGLHYPLSKEQVYRDSMVVVPSAFKNIHTLTYNIVYYSAGAKYEFSRNIPYFMVFSDDSTFKIYK